MDRKLLEQFPGVGRKTVNVFLSEFYQFPAFAVDTHVERLSKRLQLAKKDDTVVEVETKLKRVFPKEIPTIKLCISRVRVPHACAAQSTTWAAGWQER